MFVFVYGSLKKDFKFHYLLENRSIFIGNAKTIEKYSLFRYKNFDFPYMNSIPSSVIHGELYKIDKKTLKDLDLLEGYPIFYNRKQIQVISNGSNYLSYVYFLKEDLIEKGSSLNNWTIDNEAGGF